MYPIHFGPQERTLFGLFHPPDCNVRTDSAVVICNPFGQEAIRAHRVLRVLADRLARQGHAVLRFDYFGTGDSTGDDAQGDLAGWFTDVIAADAELRRRSGVSGIVWLGMRLGGTVALGASQTATARPSRLVLWDPVLEGRRYLDLLRRRHVENLDAAFSLCGRPTAQERAVDPQMFLEEALGFAISPVLRQQLLALTPGSVEWPRSVPVSLVIDPAQEDQLATSSLTALNLPSLQMQRVGHGVDWLTDSAENTALVPAQAVAALVQQCVAP
jgi:uncharacterized protein